MAMRVYSSEFLRRVGESLLRAVPASTGKLSLDFSTTSGQRLLALMRDIDARFTIDMVKQALITGTETGLFVWTGTALLTADKAAQARAELQAKAAMAKVSRDDDRRHTSRVVSALAAHAYGASESELTAALDRELAAE